MLQQVDRSLREMDRKGKTIEEDWLRVSPSLWHVFLMVLLFWKEYEATEELRERIRVGCHMALESERGD